MQSASLQQQKQNQLKALSRFLIIAIIAVASLMAYQAYNFIRAQIEYQESLMQSVSDSFLKEMGQYLTQQRLKLLIFQNQNVNSLNDQYRDASNTNKQDYQQMLAKIKSDFPDSRLYTLITPQGQNLLEHLTGKFLESCRKEMMQTIKDGQQSQLFLHRGKTANHFDLIQPRDVNDPEAGYLFVAFNTLPLENMLEKYQLPYQQLFLLRRDKVGQVEMASGFTQPENADFYFDGDALSEFEHATDIPGTLWQVAIRLDPHAKTEIRNAIAWQSAISWIFISSLLLLAFMFIRRNLESKFQSRLKLDRSRKNAETIINSVNEAVFSIDKDQTIRFANNRAKSLLQMSVAQIEGANFSRVCLLYYLQDNNKLQLTDMIAAYENNQIPEYSNLRLKLNQDLDIPVAVKLAPIYDEAMEKDGYTITIEDLSTAIELSKRLVFHESRDNLTGLFNRRQLDKKLNVLLNQVKTEDTPSQAAIILIDLDNFKILNSVHGFDGSDEYLKRIAILLEQLLKDSQCLARLSGDEFAAVYDKISSHALPRLASKIKSTIQDFRFEWNHESISTSACLGIVRIDDQFNRTDDILAAADHACRLAKSKGQNIIQFYQNDDPEIQQRTREVTHYSDLQKALADDRFVLYRQAIRGTQDEQGDYHKYEILVRMLDDDSSIVAPGSFIPAAEKYGLMEDIDQWVMANTFANLAHLGDKDSASYNINLSSKTLSDRGIVSFTNGLFDRYAIEPSRINFEVTETSAISYLDNALGFMYAMKARGCTFSLDDFGTGLASFDYLRKLPIDFLKIDGVFVKDIDTHPNDFAFIEAIHKISSQMGIKTVAEFVENQKIVDLLLEIGIDYVQGFYIQKPRFWPLQHCQQDEKFLNAMDNLSQD